MKRRRNKKSEDHINHERWLVSYADFITLLFAFFVVMYAISSVNVGKYRVLSESLVAAFRHPPRSIHPINPGEVQTSNPFSPSPLAAFPSPVIIQGLPQIQAPPEPPARSVPNTPKTTPIQKMGKIIEHKLRPLVSSGLISVQVHPNWVDIRIKADVLFPSGSARIDPTAVPVIEDVAKALRQLPVQVQVEGFTDNVPIHNSRFDSNWGLSAARAVSVVQLLIHNGMPPQRLAAVGYGKYHPIASNATPKGRAMNRRVELVVVAQNTAVPTRLLPSPPQTGGG